MCASGTAAGRPPAKEGASPEQLPDWNLEGAELRRAAVCWASPCARTIPSHPLLTLRSPWNH